MSGREAIGGIVLAAGAGRRFGGAKQLAPLGGVPLLEHALAAMAAVPVIAPIAVVLGAHADDVREQVDFGFARPVVCDAWSEGQAASLRCGLDAVGEVDAVVVTLGDQPRIAPQAIAALLLALDEPAPAARALYRGRPGHPVLIKRALFPAVRALRGDAGARDLLERANVLRLETGDLGSPADVDTPEQLAALARSASC
jgi:CTP:molybdopterin cytidylyltransferase MocA